MNFKKYHVSRNLFDKSKRTDNSSVVYTTGEISTLYGVFVSDFTPIEPNTTYTLNIVSDISGKTEHLFALYDENKNFVDTDSHEATQATVYTFTTPANVAYIRFNGNMASVDEIMLNTGSTALPYEPYSSEVWHATPHYIHNTSTDTITTLPAVLYPNDTTATVGLKGNMEQQSSTTTVPSKSVTVLSLESDTNYALFPKEDFPNAVVGDTINIVVSDTSYSQKVMKIDASYVYIENRTV